LPTILGPDLADYYGWDVLTLFEELAEELLRCGFISMTLYENI